MRLRRHSQAHHPTAPSASIDLSGDSIDSDWGQESEVSSDDFDSVTASESLENVSEDDAENIPIIIPAKVST